MDTKDRIWLSSSAFLKQHEGLIGRNAFYEGVRRGEIPHIKLGRKILVPSDALDRLLAKRTGEAE